MVIVLDMDDTLYNEIDFVKSGFREIASYLDADIYDEMMAEFEKNGSGKIFNRYAKDEQELKKLIEIYRFHAPNISLEDEKLLDDIKQHFQTALITDGHYIMQQNKYNKLNLEKWIDYAVFTDKYHTKKPNKKPYEMVQNHFKDENRFCYIADNPKKDFLAPKELGWLTIRYKNPVGVYRDEKNDADFEIENLSDVLEIINE